MEVDSSVEWAFSLNEKNLLNIIKNSTDIGPPYLSYLNHLFSYLQKEGCKNVPKKLESINNEENFYSCVSELDAAVFFLENGKKVEILPDNYYCFCGSEPDLLVKDDVLSIRSLENSFMYRSDVDIKRIIATQSTTKSQGYTTVGVVTLILGFLISLVSYIYLGSHPMVYLGALLIVIGIALFLLKQKTAILNIDVEGEEPYTYNMQVDETLIHVFQDKINEARRHILKNSQFSI